MPAPRPPGIAVRTETASRVPAAAVAVGFSLVDGRPVLDRAATAAVDAIGVDAFALLDRVGAEGFAGEIVAHEVFGDVAPGSPSRVVLVGLGAERPADFRRAGAALIRASGGGRTPVATPIAARADDDQLAAFVEGAVLGGFAFSRRSADDARDPAEVVLADVRRGRARVVDAAVARSLASWRSRTFALTPSNEKSPETLERWARDAAAAGGLAVDVWDERRLARDGFGGILAVGRGSQHPARFIRLDHRPRGSSRAPLVVLVGKGITFDTGGLSLKPRAYMENMKRDMTGAGVVIAVMAALRELGVALRVTGLIATAENAIGAAAMRPGDVITHYGGRTSEVGNTDAEGRLVLADALAYADDQLEADTVVDVATLTGAARVALGTTMGALFAADDALAAELVAAGDAAGEPVWRLPLSDEYEPLLRSPVADATNSAGGPGAITAALFLQHFTTAPRWAHLDLASIGDSPVDAFEYTQGATGFGARLLLRWLGDA